MTTTATQYALPAAAGGTPSASPSPSASLDPATAIDGLIQKLAPNATLAVAGQASVAGQQTYTLTLTPTSPITTFGSVTVAIDGQRWVPLRRAGLRQGRQRRRSCRPASRPCPSARLEQPVHLHAAERRQGRPQDGERASGPRRAWPAWAARPATSAAQHKPLTLAQAKSQAPFLLTPSSTPTGIEFKGAFVTPAATAGKAPSGLTAGQQQALATLAKHPTAVLDYGIRIRHRRRDRVEDDDHAGRPDPAAARAGVSRSARRPSTACPPRSCRRRWARPSRSGRAMCGWWSSDSCPGAT